MDANAQNVNVKLFHGDCIEKLQELIKGNIQVDSIVTDPPYELGFMGKIWDKTGIANNVEFWKLCLQVLKPGGHLLSFGGSRTYHRMACAIEEAGFEIRDQIMWVYGQGFPKSLNLSKAIDKIAGVEREIIGNKIVSKNLERNGLKGDMHVLGSAESCSIDITAPATEAAKQWDGWGTALKPAHEPIVLARKPLSEKTIAANVLKYGTGVINIDGCRVETQEKAWTRSGKADSGMWTGKKRIDQEQCPLGRFPANLIHDGSDEVEAEFAKYSEKKSGTRKPTINNEGNGLFNACKKTLNIFSGDTGTASRFFYCAKASASERNRGLEERNSNVTNDGRQTPIDNPFQRGQTLRKNTHPTVKPIALMKYLCRLVTPPNGIVLDPFMGSGSTGIAALEEGFNFIGIEKESDYIDIAERRINTLQTKALVNLTEQ